MNRLLALLKSPTLPQSFLFFYAVLGAFFLTLTLNLFAAWTGDAPTWHILLPGFLGGCALMWVVGKFAKAFIGPRVCAWIAFGVALIACLTTGDSVALVEQWYTVCQAQSLTYDAWRAFITSQACAWWLPALLTFPLLWARNEAPRGRLTSFCGFCVGVLLARILVGTVATNLLLDLTLGGMLLFALLWMCATAHYLWGRILAGCLLVLFSFAYYVGTMRAPQDLLRDVHPFAAIAMPDSLFRGSLNDTPESLAKYTFLNGRIVRVAGVDEASLVASQTLPLLLKPAPNARIVARPQSGAPVYDFYETGELKGKCDALWIELPPAWLAAEQDYFRSGALATIQEHLLDDGILIYDMDARPLDEEMLRRRAAILRTKFPHVQLWMTGANRWQLAASGKPITTSIPAIDALCERETVMKPLFAHNIDTPQTLLACCIVPDTTVLPEVEAKLRFREATLARRKLFTRDNGQGLAQAFLPHLASPATWVQSPHDNDLLQILGEAAKLRLTGLAKANNETLQYYKAAGTAIENDPEFLDKAQRDYETAQNLEKLGKYNEALALYAHTMTYAQPSLAQALHAANLAQKCRKYDLAEQFYRVAADIDEGNPLYLKLHINFLRETGNYKAAEAECSQLLRILAEENPQEMTLTRFWLGVCIAQQPDREKEGLRMLRHLLAQLSTPEEKALYVPAYGQLLIDLGHFVEGRKLRRTFEETGTLPPPSAIEQ